MAKGQVRLALLTFGVVLVILALLGPRGERDVKARSVREPIGYKYEGMLKLQTFRKD